MKNEKIKTISKKKRKLYKLTIKMDIPVFTTIKTFVADLHEIYGQKQKTLALYNRLLQKTSIEHEESVQKHIDAFRKFVTTNRSGILAKDTSLMNEHKVFYNDRVYINIFYIINSSDAETKSVIWTHLLVLSAYLDPLSGAKDKLKQTKKAPTGKIEMPEGPTGDFLGNIVNTLQDTINVDESSNPMDVFGQIMNSGAFSNILGMVTGGMDNGQIDMGQLMGMAQGMLSQMGGPQGGGGEGGMPDIGAMLKQFGMDENALAAMSSKIEENAPQIEGKSE